MKHEWFLVRYMNGEFIDKSPYAMSKREVESLLTLAPDDGFTYKVVHENELKG